MMVGRIKEIEILNDSYNDNKSHFIVIYGRRRVGKTFLVRECFKDKFTFCHTGSFNRPTSEQLKSFNESLSLWGLESCPKLTNWLDAFNSLKKLIINNPNQRKVLFIDELSWIDNPKSDFVSALELFWNGWASARTDIILIVCSSSTSWMINKIIHNKGGLYNRLTDKINLHPFNLFECRELINSMGLIYDNDQILQGYMILGGIPFYWQNMKKGLSLHQNIDYLFFSEDAPLKEEFKYLYSSIFNNPEGYLKIIEALTKKNAGLTREEIINATNLPNSGETSKKLEELVSSGFIREYNSFGNKNKSKIYQIIDFFTIFHYRFLINKPTDVHFWTKQNNTPSQNNFLGFAFERVCFNHINQIKNKLSIGGVLTETQALYLKKNIEKGIFGSQIDLLIVRNDQVINLCEIKYSKSIYNINNSFVENMNKKINDLSIYSNNKYGIYPTLITTVGLEKNIYYSNIQNLIVLDDLFKEYVDF